MQRQLGIRVGEIWAYRESSSLPLARAKIVDPGTHYDAYIESVLIDYPGQPRRNGRRAKYPCMWDDLDQYLAVTQSRAAEARKAAGPYRLKQPAVPRDLNLSVPEVIAVMMGRADQGRPTPIAYDIAAAAEAVGYSEATIRLAIAEGSLVPRYANSKAVILYEDLRDWARKLPTERPSTHG